MLGQKFFLIAEENQDATKDEREHIATLLEVNQMTLPDKEAVEVTRGTYNALTKAQQKLVRNVEMLEVVAEQITKLEAQQTESENRTGSNQSDSGAS